MKKRWLFVCLGLIGFGFSALFAQKHPNSPVLKSYVPTDSHSLVLPGDLSYDLWQNFMLMKKANDGDPIAQHELGIRYISGKGFPADTVKAAYWITKAAAQGLPSARFNLGILEDNGWGLPWNPFDAYKDFQFAAHHEMPEAEYALGIAYLDNLVVPRDEKEAYCRVQAAADSGYEPAMETLTIFAQRGIGKKGPEENSLSNDTAMSSPSKVIYLDFNRDTSSHSNDTTLAEEASQNGSEELRKRESDQLLTADTTAVDTSIVRLVQQAADAGSPEALTMMGRWYEMGTYVKQDAVTASLYYIRAIHCDSPRAPELLWNLVHGHQYFELLKSRVDKKDADAESVWASLIALQFDYQLTQEQALGMLETAAKKKNISALIELGLWYAQGGPVEKSRTRAIALWREAALLGSREAKVRYAVSELMSSRDSSNVSDVVPFLTDAMHDGSVLAEVALGFCAEEGFGVPQNIGEASRLYRKSAQRGSVIGFNALKRLYDSIRPAEVQFRTND